MKPLHKVLITGSREWNARPAIESAIRAEGIKASAAGKVLVVIHGDYRPSSSAPWLGADLIAEHVCEDLGVFSVKVPARWSAMGLGAGPRRNGVMVALGPDICYAFPLASSKGTVDCIRQARNAGIRVVVYGEETQ